MNEHGNRCPCSCPILFEDTIDIVEQNGGRCFFAKAKCHYRDSHNDPDDRYNDAPGHRFGQQVGCGATEVSHRLTVLGRGSENGVYLGFPSSRHFLSGFGFDCRPDGEILQLLARLDRRGQPPWFQSTSGPSLRRVGRITILRWDSSARTTSALVRWPGQISARLFSLSSRARRSSTTFASSAASMRLFKSNN